MHHGETCSHHIYPSWKNVRVPMCGRKQKWKSTSFTPTVARHQDLKCKMYHEKIWFIFTSKSIVLLSIETVLCIDRNSPPNLCWFRSSKGLEDIQNERSTTGLPFPWGYMDMRILRKNLKSIWMIACLWSFGVWVYCILKKKQSDKSTLFSGKY